MGADTCKLPLEQEIAFSDKVSRKGSLVPSWSLMAAGYHYEYPTVASANGIPQCLQSYFHFIMKWKTENTDLRYAEVEKLPGYWAPLALFLGPFVFQN